MTTPNSRQLAIAALALLALAVVFLLPAIISEPLVKAPEPIEADTAAPQTVAPSRAAEKKRFREKAQDTLARVFELRDELEQMEVSAWGGGRYRQALDTVAAGDKQYSRGDYEQSLESYDRARASLESLRAESETLLSDSLEAVEQAIESGLVEEARHHLELLNYLAPEDPGVVRFGERVEALPEVAALIEEGRRLREENEPGVAAEAFAGAVERDPDHRRAAELLDQVERDQRESRFRRRMGQGYNALEQGDYAAARAHFDAAGEIRPRDAAVDRALSRLENRRTRLEVDRALSRARTLEQREEWQQAVEVYRRLIELDSSLTEPRARLVPARARAELDSRLRELIDRPLALSRPEVAARARQALGDARSIASPGDKLAGQIERLSTLLERSNEPVPVQLKSDNHTHVTLFRVGRLGTFESKTVALKPGKYIAAGTRKGFRDVRVEFTVSGETPVSPIVVRCTEAI